MSRQDQFALLAIVIANLVIWAALIAMLVNWLS